MTNGGNDAAGVSVRRVRWWHCVGAGLAYALLTVLSFPPFSLWPLAFLSVVPLVMVGMSDISEPRRAGLLCAVGASPLWVFEMSWVFRVTWQGFVPVCLYLSLYAWLFVWLFAKVRRIPRLPAAVGGAVVWTALEVVRGEIVWDGYPWYLVSEPLIDAGVLAMPVRIVGLYGLSFLVTVLGVGVYVAIASKRERKAGVASVLGAFVAWGVLAAAGVRSGAAPSAGLPLRVALVQTNIPSDNKIFWSIDQRLRDLERFEELTRAAAAKTPDFIVWPETMFPGRSLDTQAVDAEKKAGIYLIVKTAEGEHRVNSWHFAERLAALQASVKIPLVVGAIGVDNLRIGTGSDGRPTFENDGRYNSAFVLAGGRLTGERYDKIELTPFGEYMPYISSWPWLEKQLMSVGAHGMAFDLAKGKRTDPLLLPLIGREAVAFAAPICFEVTKPSGCRELVTSGRGALLIVNLTNDGWFGDSDKTRLQHLQLARWRSLELATPMVRAANTGICAAIDRTGSVTFSGVEGQPMAAGVEGVLTVDVEVAAGACTFFAAYGDIVRWPMLVVGAILVAASFVSGRPPAARTP